MQENTVQENHRQTDFAVAYYQNQYERIDKLETQRLTMTNIVISITAAVFAFSYQNTDSLSFANGLVLPLIVILANLMAMLHIQRCSQYMSIHQARAHRCLNHFDKEVAQIQNAPELKFPANFLGIGRKKSQLLIHSGLVLAALAPISMYLFQN